MRSTRNVKLGIWLLLTLNVLMTFATIWVFARMAPAIGGIITRNSRSIEEAQHMLVYLAEDTSNETKKDKALQGFRRSLQLARGNITESNEKDAIDEITAHFEAAFNGDPVERELTLRAIEQLNKVNTAAVERTDQEAVRLGAAGAWGAVVLGSLVFCVGLLYARYLMWYLVAPLEEVYETVAARHAGDPYRRCFDAHQSHEIKEMYRRLNELFDDSVPPQHDA